jgi:16S rRNA (uracil1498-N3)-methyltransferase
VGFDNRLIRSHRVRKPDRQAGPVAQAAVPDGRASDQTLMTRRRFYAPPQAFAANNAVTLGADESQHLRNVLRLKTGDEVYVFDGAGREFRGEIHRFSRMATDIHINEEVAPVAAESPLHLTMAVALLKGEKFDLVIQKLTELGVNCVVPTMTKRADVRLRNDDDAERKLIRWRRIVMEATKQCGRAHLMRIASPTTFDQLVNSPAAEGERFMFAERDGAHLRTALPDKTTSSQLTAMVGSEGGWTDDELNQARDSGWQIVTLGGRIMRAETAAVTCAALLQHQFGDLN